jgi:hypothetical protein
MLVNSNTFRTVLGWYVKIHHWICHKIVVSFEMYERNDEYCRLKTNDWKWFKIKPTWISFTWFDKQIEWNGLCGRCRVIKQAFFRLWTIIKIFAIKRVRTDTSSTAKFDWQLIKYYIGFYSRNICYRFESKIFQIWSCQMSINQQC